MIFPFCSSCRVELPIFNHYTLEVVGDKLLPNQVLFSRCPNHNPHRYYLFDGERWLHAEPLSVYPPLPFVEEDPYEVRGSEFDPTEE